MSSGQNDTATTATTTSSAKYLNEAKALSMSSEQNDTATTAATNSTAKYLNEAKALSMSSEQNDTATTAATTSSAKYLNEAKVEWTEEDDNMMAKFVCRACSKTFYNANALQNHKNLQHDMDGSSSDGNIALPTPVTFTEHSVNGLCGFKFIPLKSEGPEPSTDNNDDMTPRIFEVDTTYLIIKVSTDLDTVKRRRLDGVVKRAEMTPSVDLRGPFTCTFPSSLPPDFQCRQIFFNCCEYSLHYREEHTKRRKAALRCQVCEKRLDRDFFPTTPLAVHLAAANRVTFSCRLCGQTFLDSAQYDEHNRSIHAKVKPHQCAVCSKRFTQHGGLQQHMRMHTGIRPFRCTYCSKAFTQKAGLDQHVRTHTKVKPFKCVVCFKSFSQSVHLRQHMRTHTNIQPFQCRVCFRRFKQTSHLNFHMRAHGEEGAAPAAAEGADAPAQVPSELEYLNLANLKPMGAGGILYYAAEVAPGAAPPPFLFPPPSVFYQPRVILPGHILPI